MFKEKESVYSFNKEGLDKAFNRESKSNKNILKIAIVVGVCTISIVGISTVVMASGVPTVFAQLPQVVDFGNGLVAKIITHAQATQILGNTANTVPYVLQTVDGTQLGVFYTQTETAKSIVVTTIDILQKLLNSAVH